jgi:peptidoglycan/xylan/chitin deacetylase (PgdA/CDA1 family)
MTLKWKNVLSYGVSLAGLMPTVRHVFAGRAVIIMFHEIHQNCEFELMTGTSSDLFEYSLNWLRQEGWEIVSLEGCLQRLVEDDSSHRYAVLTFDDGYRDNVLTALPILERCNAPFIVYVPTGALTRSLQAWWLGLRELFRSRDDVLIDAMGARFHCPDFKTKASALSRVTEWVHEDYSRVELLFPTFVKAGLSISALNDTYFLGEDEIRVVSRHPLASVGGHTTSHMALKTLDALSARAEMIDNRLYLENLLQRQVRHFAYPYGGFKAFGPREEHLASEVGFLSAATTLHGHLYSPPSNCFALPRVYVGASDTRISFQSKINGLQRAFEMGVWKSSRHLINEITSQQSFFKASQHADRY